MGYIALKALRIGVLNDNGEQTHVQVVEPGEPVPGIENWTYANIIAHLNMDYIKWAGEGAPAHKSYRANVVDMAEYRGDNRPPRKGSVPAKGTEEGLQRGATPGAQLPCPHCERRFGNKGALSNHVKRHGAALSEQPAGAG